MSHLPVPDINKRQRDDATEALIREALEEEQQRKKAKKSGGLEGVAPVKAKQKPKGKTLHEIEEEEGGPVKESMVGMAAVQRAIRRKKKEADDEETGLLDDIAACEEEDEEGEGAQGADGDGDMDMFGEDDEQQAAAAAQRQKQWGGRKVPKGISAAVAAAMESDGGFAVTRFNMNEERQEGNIDAEGNFVAAQDDDETAKDAWLNSDEAKPISNKALAAAAAQRAAMDAADEAPALSETAVAKAQREVASLLLPGESVSEGLRRLAAAGGGPAAGKGKALGKREKQRLAQQQQQQQSKKKAAANGSEAAASAPAAAAMDASAAAAAFTRLTELADLLLNAGGELGVYSQRKEQLERFAKAVLPEHDILAAPAGGGGEGEDDMFADEDEQQQQDKGRKPPDGQGTGGAGAQQQPAAAAGAAAANGAAAAAAGAGDAAAAGAAAAAAAAEAVDYGSWPVKELRRFLTERGVDSSSIVEKGDLVAQVKRVAAQGPATTSAAAAAAPAGYNFDRASGYFYNADTGLYWDSKSGAYYNSSDQKWYSWDAAAAEYKEIAATGGS